MEIQSESADSLEFLEHLKVDLFPDEVYVFTPKGKILSLPKGATAVDFAYAVHTDIGNRCVAVKINQELAPLRSELRNGDHVEIITAAHAHPNSAWLNYVVTGKARAHIRDRLTQLAPVFLKNKYMLGDEFSMLDVAIAPLLWRLEHYGIDLSRNAAPLLKYAERIFSRPAYIEALTPSEKVMRR